MTGVLSRHRRSCAEASWRRGGAAAIAVSALGVVFCARPAAAETLVEALSNAYLINPVLNAERANLRATDEQVAVAKVWSAPRHQRNRRRGLPKPGNSDVVGGSRQKVQTCDEVTRLNEPAFCASLDAAAAAATKSITLPDDGVTHPRGYSVTLTQPIFEGFQNYAIRQAKATVQAGLRRPARHGKHTMLLERRHRLC